MYLYRWGGLLGVGGKQKRENKTRKGGGGLTDLSPAGTRPGCGGGCLGAWHLAPAHARSWGGRPAGWAFGPAGLALFFKRLHAQKNKRKKI